jgi:hypothetical protein
MQLQLPLFPKDTTFISSCLGVYEKEGLVQYIANGLPVYSHSKDDLKSFRYITSNFIHEKLCRKTEVERCFHVSEDSVQRAYKKFVKEGAEGFFSGDNRKGTAHKIIGEKKQRIQNKLDKGQSVNSIAKQEGVRESAIRYQLVQGYLKKSPHQIKLAQHQVP